MAAGPEIIPIEHASVIVRWGDAILYADPVGADLYRGQPKADVVLLTDIHGDHFHPETLAAVLGDAELIVPSAVHEQLPDELKARAKVLRNGESLELKGLRIEAVPMYNYPEKPDSWHTRGRGNGYLIEKDGTRLYIAGDTSGTPEMRALKNIDIALVPMNLPYTMSVEEAADAVLEFAPKQVYPYHYRSPDGLSDVKKFKQLVNEKNPSVEVVLAEWYPAK